MCALFGYLDYGHKVSIRFLQKLVQALANASEVRGTHASGIAYMQNNSLTIYKRPKPAHKMHFRLPAGTAAVMGHTRYTTQGSQNQNYNNHPFRGHAGTDFALAHNGVLYNDHALRLEKHLPDTKIETDSYIAVQLIEAEKALNFSAIRSMTEAVLGNYTFTILDTTNAIWFVKGSSPLYLLHFPEIGLYVYTSTKEIMHHTIFNTGLKVLTYEVIDVEDGEIVKLAADGAITREAFLPTDDLVQYKWSFRSFCSLDELTDDDEYAQIYRMAGYFGIEREEIDYLREMGCSYDEIEEYLMCPDAYEKALIAGEF